MKWMMTTGAVVILGMFGTNLAAQTAGYDRVRDIERAAAEIGVIQKKSGADGAFAAINECYDREFFRTTALSRELEACMAQDMVVSRVTAAFYSSMPSKDRKMAGAEEPDAVLKAMSERVVGTMARFKVPHDDAVAFFKIVNTRGLEAYSRAQFPDQFPAKK